MIIPPSFAATTSKPISMAIVIIETIQKRNTVVVIRRVLWHIAFACLFGPHKKNDEESVVMMPSVYKTANLTIYPLIINKSMQQDRSEISDPIQKHTAKPYTRCLRVRLGHKL